MLCVSAICCFHVNQPSTMMKFKLLISVASAMLALAEYDVPPELHLDDESFQEIFERLSKIDTSNIPYFNSSQSVSKPCSRLGTYSWPLGGRKCCPKIHYWVEEELIPGSVNIMATPQINIEADVSANGSSVLFNTSQTTVIFDYDAEGWSLDVQPKSHDLGNLFTRGKIQPRAHRERETIKQTTEYHCPAWHDCQVQVLSWHATVLGKCKSTAKFACSRELRMCDQKKEDLRCEASQRYYDQHCHGDRSRACGFTVPLFGQSGMPRSEINMLTRDRRPHFTGCFKGFPWATLSNGEVYNPVDDSYFVHSSGVSRWYTKDRSEPPPLMPREFPCPRPQATNLESLRDCTDAACQQFRDDSLVREHAGGD
ncbi:hypothetical protein L249_5194 [Ophiocordyceps polyrhachis-furcata BCC 54312]|uniref:Uncharacterized protein n=1 Tax=Ophiocordyceps polyrhachis-furcata BCC 54312 TaxID=1330021 RepID=A0A367L8U9_9HYPO|nr:hypothetical protein L249_5194 [Ophiocordyceps polyrhachis-furcata BCC 54312]